MIPLGKNIRWYFLLKVIAVFILVTGVSVSAGIGVFLYLQKEVVINDDGNSIIVKTMKSTVEEVLDENGIQVAPADYINLPLYKELSKTELNEIHIKRAVPVNILVDGRQKRVMTYKDTVKEVLEDNNIVMAKADKLAGTTLDDKIFGGMDIRIIRVTEEYQYERIPIPYTVVRQENNRMDQGTERVVREGKEGIREKVYKVVYEDGVEVSRTLIKDANILNPVSKLIEYGTVLNFKTSRGETVRYKKVLNMRATAYTSSYEHTGKTPDHPAYGITYTGMKARKGVIAVDPSVIPLGTKVYVQGVGGTPDYGFAVAADIGSAVKGDLIDLYFEDEEVARNWGVRKVKVYILYDN